MAAAPMDGDDANGRPGGERSGEGGDDVPDEPLGLEECSQGTGDINEGDAPAERAGKNEAALPSNPLLPDRAPSSDQPRQYPTEGVPPSAPPDACEASKEAVPAHSLDGLGAEPRRSARPPKPVLHEHVCRHACLNVRVDICADMRTVMFADTCSACVQTCVHLCLHV